MEAMALEARLKDERLASLQEDFALALRGQEVSPHCGLHNVPVTLAFPPSAIQLCVSQIQAWGTAPLQLMLMFLRPLCVSMQEKQVILKKLVNGHARRALAKEK